MPDLQDFVVARSGTLLDAMDIIERNRSRTAIVVESGKVIGVISEGDILRALLDGVDIHAPLHGFVQIGFRYLTERDLGEAIKLMHPRGITLLPVVDRDFRLEDVVTLSEVLDFLVAQGQR